MTTAGVNRLLVIGLGLIGGSLAQAARQRQLCREVWGVSRSPETLVKAVDNEVVDRTFTDLKEAVSLLGGGDMVLIGVPTLSVAAVLEQLAPLVDPAVTVTDVASVKGSVVEAARAAWGAMPASFVPGHPIAGSERSGIDAVNPGLFVNHRIILTPLAETGAAHIERVTQLWQGVGATVTPMTVAEHDEVLAATSHLPHLLAYSLVDTLAHMRANHDIFRYAAGGFRDFTRIAASDPVMWHDIVLARSHDRPARRVASGDCGWPERLPDGSLYPGARGAQSLLQNA